MRKITSFLQLVMFLSPHLFLKFFPKYRFFVEITHNWNKNLPESLSREQKKKDIDRGREKRGVRSISCKIKDQAKASH